MVTNSFSQSINAANGSPILNAMEGIVMPCSTLRIWGSNFTRRKHPLNPLRNPKKNLNLNLKNVFMSALHLLTTKKFVKRLKTDAALFFPSQRKKAQKKYKIAT